MPSDYRNNSCGATTGEDDGGVVVQNGRQADQGNGRAQKVVGMDELDVLAARPTKAGVAVAHHP